MTYDKSAKIFAKPGYRVAFHKPKYDKTYGLRLFIGFNPTGPYGGRSGNVVNGSATKIFTKYSLCADLIEKHLNAYLASLTRPVTLKISWGLWGGKYHVEIVEINRNRISNCKKWNYC